MNNLDKYDSTTERLSDTATPEERLEKFSKIVEELRRHGITLEGLSNGCPVVSDGKGWKLTHNIITWQIFRVEDVVDMILNNQKNSITSSNH